MKTSLRNIVLICLAFVASAAFADSPVVEVTVRNPANGKVMEKVKTNTSGQFALNRLPAGAYTLEFRSQRSPNLKDKQFTLTINGTRQTGTQGGIAGTSLVGGVTLNVVVAAHAKVSGQIATGIRVEQAKRMVWVPKSLASNLPGHWAEEGTTAAPGYNVVQMPKDIFQKRQLEGRGMQ